MKRSFKRYISIMTCLCVFLFYGQIFAFSESKEAKSDKYEYNSINTEFSDVQEKHWAYSSISWAVKSGIVKGFPDGKFLPEKHVSRAEFATFMVKGLNIKVINPSEPSFIDVDKDNWAFKYVETVKPYLTWFQISQGNKFFPNNPSVREDMAVTLVKVLGLANSDIDVDKVLSNITDSNAISTNLRKYVAIAINKGLMSGYEDSSFRPQGNLTRSETVALLYKAVNSLKGTKIIDDHSSQDGIKTTDPYTNQPTSSVQSDVYANSEKLESVQSTVYVNNVLEFIESIGPNKKILLASPKYNLYEIDKDKYQLNKYVSWEKVADGYKMIISNIKNMTIEEVEGNKAEIVTQSRFADVLTFKNCNKIYISNITLGHEAQKGTCIGGVLNFSNSNTISLNLLDIYGCGAQGLELSKVTNFTMNSSTIRDCSQAVMTLKDSKKLLFTNSKFSGNSIMEDAAITDINSKSITFEKCEILDNIKDKTYSDDAGRFLFSNNTQIKVINTTIKNNTMDFFSDGSSKLFTIKNVNFENNDFDKNLWGK